MDWRQEMLKSNLERYHPARHAGGIGMAAQLVPQGVHASYTEAVCEPRKVHLESTGLGLVVRTM